MALLPSDDRLIATGAMLVLLGGMWTLYIYVVPAWPTALPLIIMGLGAILVATGLSMRSGRTGIQAFAVLAIIAALGFWLWWTS